MGGSGRAADDELASTVEAGPGDLPTRAGPPGRGVSGTLTADHGDVPDLGGWTGDERGRYALEDEIARGGGGRVVAARDRRLGREVAVKLPLDEPGSLQRINNCLSRLVITAATLVTGATGCLQAGDGLGTDTSPVVVITKSDLDAIPQGEDLRLSADGGYRFDTGRGPLSLNRIVVGETPLADSFRDGGVSDAQLDWIQSAGFTLTPMTPDAAANKPGDAEQSSLAASCTDRAYNILYYVAPSGSVSEYKVWFCRA